MRSTLTRVLTYVTPAVLLFATACAVDETLAEDEGAATSTGGYGLRLESDHFAAGEEVLLQLYWSAPPDHEPSDTLRMYRVGAGDDDFIAWTYVGGMDDSGGASAGAR